MQTSSRKVLIILAGLVLAGFVVYQSTGFVRKANFSGQKLLHAVAGANLYLLLLPIFVIYGCYTIRALRWQLFQGFRKAASEKTLSIRLATDHGRHRGPLLLL